MFKFNNFRNNMKLFRQTVGYFCFLKRQDVMIEILWDEVKRRFPEDNVHTRRIMLIELIEKLAEKERPGCTTFIPLKQIARSLECPSSLNMPSGSRTPKNTYLGLKDGMVGVVHTSNQ